MGECVCICGCGFQLQTEIVKVKLDSSNLPLPSAGGAFLEEAEAKPLPTTALHWCSRTSEVGAVCVGVCVRLCVST